MDYLKIEVSRDCYRPDAVRKTMTVGELIATLKQYDETQKVIISHDCDDMFCGIEPVYIEQDTFNG